MVKNLRRAPAKADCERRTSGWAPEAWEAARAASKAGTFPELRFPVIIGGTSMFRSPEDLCDLLELPSVPPLTQTTETTSSLLPHGEEKEDAQGKETLDITDISLGKYFDLEELTEGKTVVVWFRGQKQKAWLASSRKPSRL